MLCLHLWLLWQMIYSGDSTGGAYAAGDVSEEDLSDFNPFAPNQNSDEDSEEDAFSDPAVHSSDVQWLDPLLPGNARAADDIFVDEVEGETQQLSTGEVLEELPYNVAIQRAYPCAVMLLAKGKFRVTSSTEQILRSALNSRGPAASVVREGRHVYTHPITKRSVFEKLPVLGVKRVGSMTVARSDAKVRAASAAVLHGVTYCLGFIKQAKQKGLLLAAACCCSKGPCRGMHGTLCLWCMSRLP
jgi:hypothetical protein